MDGRFDGSTLNASGSSSRSGTVSLCSALNTSALTVPRETGRFDEWGQFHEANPPDLGNSGPHTPAPPPEAYAGHNWDRRMEATGSAVAIAPEKPSEAPEPVPVAETPATALPPVLGPSYSPTAIPGAVRRVLARVRR